jgi:hypothetical protein
MAEFDKEQEVQEQETQLEPQVEQETTQASPKERVETTMTWIDKVLSMLNKYSAKKMLQAILVVFVVIFLGLFAFKPEAIFKSYDEYKAKTHSERMDTRNNNTPLIQSELDNLRVRYGATWVSVWELHNNTNNLEGLPFIFASLNYESIKPGAIPISGEFDELRLSLHPLSTYLRKHDMWYGTVEELKEVDYTGYYRAKALGIEYLGFILMEVEGAPNAVLSFAFVEGSELPDIDDFVSSWVRTSYKINGLLTIDKKK